MLLPDAGSVLLPMQQVVMMPLMQGDVVMS